MTLSGSQGRTVKRRCRHVGHEQSYPLLLDGVRLPRREDSQARHDASPCWHLGSAPSGRWEYPIIACTSGSATSFSISCLTATSPPVAVRTGCRALVILMRKSELPLGYACRTLSAGNAHPH